MLGSFAFFFFPNGVQERFGRLFFLFPVREKSYTLHSTVSGVVFHFRASASLSLLIPVSWTGMTVTTASELQIVLLVMTAYKEGLVGDNSAGGGLSRASNGATDSRLLDSRRISVCVASSRR